MTYHVHMSRMLAVGVVATAALAIDARNEVKAEQCVHNKFGTSFVVARVEWYDRDAMLFNKNETSGNIEVWSKNGTLPKPVRTDTITAGFSSCINDFQTRLAVVKVAGAEVATWAARTGTAVAAAGAAAVVVAGGCAAGGAVTILTAGAAGAGGMALCAVSVKGAASSGFAVGGALSKLIPDAKDIIYAGYPSHHKYLDISGDAFTPKFAEGDPIKTAPIRLPIPITVEGDVNQAKVDQACMDAAAKLGPDKRWAGGEPKLIVDMRASGGGAQYFCDVVLSDVFRFVPITLDPASKSDVAGQCRDMLKPKGVTSAGFNVPRDPTKGNWWCSAIG